MSQSIQGAIFTDEVGINGAGSSSQKVMFKVPNQKKVMT